jgi:uncharacterized membrane protein
VIHYFLHGIIKIGQYIRSLIISGLIAILPIALTLVAIRFIVSIVSKCVAPLNCFVKTTPLINIPHAEIFIGIGILIILGLIYKLLIVRSLFKAIDNVLSTVPLIKTLHTGIRQLVNALSAQDGFTFKHVILVEFPRTGIYSLGFVMSEFPHQIAPTSLENKNRFFSVYIPTTPNPTTGFFIVCPEDQFKVVDLTKQEAMALIVSGGILQPERFTFRE